MATTIVGYATGTCSECGKTLERRRPADLAVCDCWQYCPTDHGKGPYGTLMDDYVPDMQPSTYKSMENRGGIVWGDLKHPMDILKKCPICGYHSTLKPVEVELS